MTRKDYIAIAQVLHDDAAHLTPGATLNEKDYKFMSDWNKGAYDQWNTTVLAFANVFGSDNRAFDRTQFLKNCGHI